jgi:hypothetical protein
LFFPFWWSCPRFLVIVALCLWCPSLWHFACVFIRCSWFHLPCFQLFCCCLIASFGVLP